MRPTSRRNLTPRLTAVLVLAGIWLGCSEVVTPEAGVDVPGPCNARHDVPMFAIVTVCDGIGVDACQRIGAEGGAGLTTYGTCMPLANLCILADHCGSFADVSTCRCGTDAPCRRGEICAAGGPGVTPHCACLGGRVP
ncbi:MAG: hypothetical protein JWM10_938 [Myxococcaceae bacterium]|nr:hypothetical protein [Myxococcaceae bacterium]